MEETNFQLHSESINELAKALCEASKKIQPAIKAVENTFFKKNYADLKAIDHACRIPLTENGLCISQLMDSTNGQLTLITILMHSSGQWLKSYYPITYDKTTPQAIGSGVAYARRYSYAAIINVVTEDDDGEAATKRETETNKGQVILKGTYYPDPPKKETGEKPKKQTDPEKQDYINKLTNAKDLIELQGLITEVKPEWNSDQFKAFTKTLFDKLNSQFTEEMKDMFDAEEAKPETVQKKGVKK